MLAWWTNVFNTEITGTLTDSHHLDVPRGFSDTHTAFVSRPVIFFYKHTSATRLLQKPPAEDCSSVLQVTICVFEPLTLVSQPQTALRDTTDLKSISPPPSVVPKLTLLFPLPWQRHYSSPHTLLTVSSILKGIRRGHRQGYLPHLSPGSKAFVVVAATFDPPDGTMERQHAWAGDGCSSLGCSATF